MNILDLFPYVRGLKKSALIWEENYNRMSKENFQTVVENNKLRNEVKKLESLVHAQEHKIRGIINEGKRLLDGIQLDQKCDGAE